jgi:quinol monooxygenase YgiN
MASHRKTTAVFTAKPGKAKELEDLLRSLTGPSRAEPGNLRYDLWRDRDDAGRLVLDELYTDDAAVEAHRAAPYFQVYLSKIGDLAFRVAVTSQAIDVA